MFLHEGKDSLGKTNLITLFHAGTHNKAIRVVPSVVAWATKVIKFDNPPLICIEIMFEDRSQIESLVLMRTNDMSEPIEPYLQLAEALEVANKAASITRAQFIREQCSGKISVELFGQHRQEWGIPFFEEELVTVDDFRRGLLWRFRDHTTSWSDNQKAKTWFLTSVEALYVRRYEFWTWDNGFDECIEIREGSYREILLSLLRDGDYQVLISPVFSNADLNDFIRTYSPENGDFTIEEIIEDYIEGNTNYTR